MRLELAFRSRHALIESRQRLEYMFCSRTDWLEPRQAPIKVLLIHKTNKNRECRLQRPDGMVWQATMTLAMIPLCYPQCTCPSYTLTRARVPASSPVRPSVHSQNKPLMIANPGPNPLIRPLFWGPLFLDLINTCTLSQQHHIPTIRIPHCRPAHRSGAFTLRPFTPTKGTATVCHWL